MSAAIDLIIDVPAGDHYHAATVNALRLADPDVEVRVVRSPEIPARVQRPDGIFIGPCSPYDDREAVIALIRRCREESIPTIST